MALTQEEQLKLQLDILISQKSILDKQYTLQSDQFQTRIDNVNAQILKAQTVVTITQ